MYAAFSPDVDKYVIVKLRATASIAQLLRGLVLYSWANTWTYLGVVIGALK